MYQKICTVTRALVVYLLQNIVLSTDLIEVYGASNFLDGEI